MRIIVLILGLVYLNIDSEGQGSVKPSNMFITVVFMKLTDIGISDSVKEELLNNLTSSTDDERTFLEIDSVRNFILVHSCFKGGVTTPCDNRYLISYQIEENNYKIVYSSNSTSYADKHQYVLDVFNYNLITKTLTQDVSKYGALNLSVKDFFKKETPQSVWEKYLKNVEPIYSFDGKKMYCEISDTGYGNTLLSEPELRTDSIVIEWHGKTFVAVDKE